MMKLARAIVIANPNKPWARRQRRVIVKVIGR